MWSPEPRITAAPTTEDCWKWWDASTQGRLGLGEPGITHTEDYKGRYLIHGLEWRDSEGELKGILTYYPDGLPPKKMAGEVQVTVHPESRRQGIGMALLKEAIALWDIQAKKQRYNVASAGLTEAWLQEDREERGLLPKTVKVVPVKKVVLPEPEPEPEPITDVEVLTQISIEAETAEERALARNQLRAIRNEKKVSKKSRVRSVIKSNTILGRNARLKMNQTVDEGEINTEEEN